MKAEMSRVLVGGAGFVLGAASAFAVSWAIVAALLLPDYCKAQDLTAEACTSLATALQEQLYVCELGLEAADRAINEIDAAANGCEAELEVCKQMCGLDERDDATR